jgi:hypothetical protein
MSESLSSKLEAEFKAELEKNPELKPREFLKLKPEWRKHRQLVYKIFKRIQEAGKPEAKAIEPEPEITVSKEQPIELPKELEEEEKPPSEKSEKEAGLEPDVQARLEKIAGKAMDRLLGLADKAMKLHEKAGMPKEDLEDSGFLILALLTKYSPQIGAYQVETVAGLHFGSLIADKIMTWRLKKTEEEEARKEAEEKAKKSKPEAKEEKSEEAEKLSTPKKPRTKEEAGTPEWAKG